ncbi:MAG: NAD(P)-dependent oxidoreductase [Candidatus Eisenbacteria bacterium]|nr:NAD(P)-dependent oxidoreductase [Candidatus Eisenbacteria bacterium]
MADVGIIHPGAMGISVAASAANGGNTVRWASEGRSEATKERAAEHSLVDAATLADLVAASSIIVSVCPPHAAEEVAERVAGIAFDGTYLDANAISPARSVRIGGIIEKAGASYVDGGIVGGPAWTPGETWLYLSGGRADDVAACFQAGPLETAVLGREPGRASALKMCYAAYTKGTTALLSAIVAAACRLDVYDALMEQWARDWPDLPESARRRATRVTRKSWRFAGEMDEIAETLESVRVPGGFHRAAGEVYRRTAHFKDAVEIPELDEVIDAIAKEEQ